MITDNSLAIHFLYQCNCCEARWLSKILANHNTYWFAGFIFKKMNVMNI